MPTKSWENPPQIHENGKLVTKISMLTEQDLTMKVRGSPSTIQIKPQTLKEIIKVKYI
jgi:hypothetical protein